MSYQSKYNKRNEYPILGYGVMASHAMIDGHGIVANFGYNKDLDNGVEETIWSSGGEFDPSAITGAQTLNIVSTSAQDTNTTGTGAWLVAIFGLDDDYNEISELTTALNGTNTVTSVNQYRAVNRVAVSYSGSNDSNVGTISLTQATSGIKLAEIPIGESITQQAIYTVPAGKTAYLKTFQLNVGKTGAGSTPQVEGEIYTYNQDSETRYNIATFILDSQRNNSLVLDQPVANPTSEKVTIYVNATSDTANTQAFCRFFMSLVENK